MLDVFVPPLAATSCVRPLPPRRIASLAAFKSGRMALEHRLGFALPTTPVQIARNGARFLWSGPGAWLVLEADAALLADSVGAQGAVTDQSDGLFLLEISGPDRRRLLGKLVPIDLHESAFAPDAVAITQAAHIGVRIWREDESFVLACFRSFAAALHHACVEAGAEFSSGRG